jgi:hypothetical protein
MHVTTRTLRGLLLACALVAAWSGCSGEAAGLLSAGDADADAPSAGDLQAEPDAEVLDLATSVPPALVPADLAFEEPVRPELAPGERLRRFLLRFHAALRRTWLVAERVGNEAAREIVGDAHAEYRLALRSFRAHEPREAIEHLRAAAALLAEARALLREELGEDAGGGERERG